MKLDLTKSEVATLTRALSTALEEATTSQYVNALNRLQQKLLDLTEKTSARKKDLRHAAALLEDLVEAGHGFQKESYLTFLRLGMEALDTAADLEGACT